MHLSIKTILEKKLKKKELYVVCLIHVPVHKALYANLSVEKNCYKCVKVYIGVYLWTEDNKKRRWKKARKFKWIAFEKKRSYCCIQVKIDDAGFDNITRTYLEMSLRIKIVPTTEKLPQKLSYGFSFQPETL